VLFGVHERDWPSLCRIARAPALVVSLFARMQIVGVTDVKSTVRASEHVHENHDDDNAIVIRVARRCIALKM